MIGAATLILSLCCSAPNDARQDTARTAQARVMTAAGAVAQQGQGQSDTTCVALLDSLHKRIGGAGGVGGVRARALNCADQADSLRRERVFDKLAPQMEKLGQLPWMIPEYNDEQPFADNNVYGPMAYIFASPFIGGFSQVWQIREQGTRGILAAVVFVDAASPPLSAPYTNLFLQPGMNCIWLANNPSMPGNWTASVSPASGPSAVCDRSVAAKGPLQVRRETGGGLKGEDYPGAARFGETTTGQPLLGVRCLDGWCEIGPPGFTQTTPLPGPAREERVRGWHDVQRLSVRDGSGLHPGPRAIIVPKPHLDQHSAADFSGVWLNVAEIRFVDDPKGTKYANWGLKKGVNQVDARNDGGTWQFRVTPSSGPTVNWSHVMRIARFDAPLPGSARFRWTLLDEGIWIPCGDACCHADGE